MKSNFPYQVVKFILRVNGIKKLFSKDPIDYQKLRKGDLHEVKSRFFIKQGLNSFDVSQTKITEFKQNSNSDKLVIYVHGGAYISGPTRLHWNALKELLKFTDHSLWLCNYPKAPEHNIEFISDQIDQVYQAAIQKYPSKRVVLIGDSVGGSLIITLVQRLLKNKQPLPEQLILICPVMDASMTNPDIDAIDAIDPMLSKVGLLSAKKMCAINGDLNHPLISPINGSFKDFPLTHLFLATDDITYPDQKLFIKKLKDDKVESKIFEAENMPHIWPLLPMMKESKNALNEILKILGKTKR